VKVLAFNSSPNMEKGATASILNPFLEGMKEAGAEVEVVYVSKLNIKPCSGCYACWFKTPGKCVHKDDMEAVLSKLQGVDVLVLATPVYVDGMTGTMKVMIDRFIPVGEPFIEIRDNHCRHPGRNDGRTAKLALVSVCGFHEIDNFDPLLVHVKAMCKNMGAEFAGALLRPHGAAIQAGKQMGLPVDEVFDAAREAGRKLVQDGKISDEILATISRELVPRDAYVQAANTFFKQTLDTLEKKGD